MIHKVLHSKEDINRLYLSRKGGERGFTNTEVNKDTSIRCLQNYIKKKNKESLITANTNNTRINRTIITRKQKWEEKQKYGHFKW